MQGQTKVTNAFQLGLLGGLGVLTAIVIGGAVQTLADIITYVAAAIFIALGLDPVVTKLEGFGLKRPMAILAVVVVLLGGLATLIWAILPTLASQGAHFIATAPAVISGLGELPLVVRLDSQLGGAISNAISSTSTFLSDNANWPKMLGGVVQVGMNIFNGFFATVVILILSLYFMASLNRFKGFLYSLVPASKREKFHDISEQVANSVGRYVIGQFSIALTNATLSYVFMTIAGIPFAVVLAFILLLLGLIPLVGSITGAAIVTLVALSVSPTTALIVAIYYLIYMQIEAYVISPRIMNKAVAVPGAVVVVAALSGGALLGVLGALVAI
ncbi:MAG: AI-2E family transporter, partial [Rhodoluna sp.]